MSKKEVGLIYSETIDGVTEKVYFIDTIMRVVVDGTDLGTYDFESTLDELIASANDEWERDYVYDLVTDADDFFNDMASEWGIELVVNIYDVTDKVFFEEKNEDDENQDVTNTNGLVYSKTIDGVTEKVYFIGTVMRVVVDGTDLGTYDFESTLDELIASANDEWEREYVFDLVTDADDFFNDMASEWGIELVVSIYDVTDNIFFE